MRLLKRLFFVIGAFLVLCPSHVALAQPFAYITNRFDNTVSVIDTTTNTLVDTIAVGEAPGGVAINPAGTRVYVANLLDDTVLSIDTATNTVEATITTGDQPNGMAVNPAGTRVYVANEEGDTVSVIDTATNSVLDTFTVGNNPLGVTVNPAGSSVYVANRDDNTVSVIDTATNTVLATIPVGVGPGGVAVNPAGTRVYVANQFDNTVSVIDTATNIAVATISAGNGSGGVAVHPAGTHVYVGNFNDNTVSVIDTVTNSVLDTVMVGNKPIGVAINPAGTRVYVANSRGDTVSVIDTATNSVAATLNVGRFPIAFGDFIGPESIGIIGDIQITEVSTNLSGTPQPGDSIAFIADTIGSESVYFRFLYKAGYGTEAYNAPGGFVIAQDWSTDNIATINFPNAGNYIVIVQATEDSNGVWNFGDPQGGMNIEVGNTAEIQLNSISIFNLSGIPTVGEVITLDVNPVDSGIVYYRFLYKAGYGTAAYNTPGGFVIAQNWSTDNIATINFPSADNYIVIVQATEDSNGVWNFGDPQGGMNINVESQ
jgi:YVTN family beta-propeller protein